MAEMTAIHEFLTQAVVHDLLHTHPNDAAADPPLPWWSDPPHWTRLREEESLQGLIATIEGLQLARDPIYLPISITQSTHRVSAKKHHEVSRMTQFIADLIPARFPHLDGRDIHIVDVGAGQAYLTRALHALFNAPTLALDADHAQTRGAQARDESTGITHKTIQITPTTLIHAINQWIPDGRNGNPVPVLLVALHACGSLTPDILRAFLSRPTHHPTWSPIAVVAVGCCYNLMSLPADFPLSSTLLSAQPPLHLPKSAFQLASQVPAHWHDSPSTLASATLAIRKVVWRALLARLSPVPLATDTGSSPAMRRLGRLNNAAYASWDTFIEAARSRLGNHFVRPFDPTRGGATANSVSPDVLRDPRLIDPGRLLESRLEVLHVLRCMLGPVVESLIVLDRVQWVREVLHTMSIRMQVDAVNLFDQATGSGRNIAIVIAPPPPTVK